MALALAERFKRGAAEMWEIMTAALALAPSGLALVPEVAVCAEEWQERIIAKLIGAELGEGNPHFTNVANPVAGANHTRTSKSRNRPK